jgi:cysteine sulfinate desulfinase
MTLPSPWRADFPAFAAFDEDGITYLDTAATAQKPKAVLDALTAYYARGAANVHRAQHRPGERATQAFEAVRDKAAAWLGADSSKEIIFTRGATEGLNLLAYGLERHFRPGDEIVISALEHHANLLPWQQLAKRREMKLVVLPLTPSGHVDLNAASQLINPRTRLVAISQLSNVLGTWQPLAELSRLAHEHGAWLVVDGAQGVVHGRHLPKELGADFYVFSGHKLYAPEAIGVLWGHAEAVKALAPWQFGGEMVSHADYQHAEFHAAPMGYEAGTPPVGAAIGLGAALDWLRMQDEASIFGHEQALCVKLHAGLAARDGVRVLGEPQIALASIVVEGIHVADLSHLLGEQGIAVRAGNHCAMPLFKRLGESGSLRISLGLYSDSTDLERFFMALDNALELLR